MTKTTLLRKEYLFSSFLEVIHLLTLQPSFPNLYNLFFSSIGNRTTSVSIQWKNTFENVLAILQAISREATKTAIVFAPKVKAAYLISVPKEITGLWICKKWDVLAATGWNKSEVCGLREEMLNNSGAWWTKVAQDSAWATDGESK